MTQEGTKKKGTLLGRKIGNVRIKERIGRGGVGIVYRGEHEVMGTSYAVKVLNARFLRDKTIAERFRREAISCGRLHHPNVVFITDFGYKEDVGIYIIMEHLKGQTLGRRMSDEGMMDVEDVGAIALQLFDALEAAHQLGIVHRDLKPDNIFLCPGTGGRELVKVLDFGIAMMKGQANLTSTGTVVGSPLYMSPEQVRGLTDQIGPCSDVYALGVVLYQMLTAKAPIWDLDVFQLCTKHVTLIPDPISFHRPGLKGTKLELLIARMLAKRVADRPASMAQTAIELHEALDQLGAKSRSRALLVESASEQGALAPEQIQNLHLAQSLRASGDFEVAELLKLDKALLTLSLDALRFACWGVLVAPLITAPVGSPRLDCALEQTASLVESALDTQEVRPVAKHFVDGVGVLLETLDRARRDLVIRALQPLSTNVHFPEDLIPAWATLQTSGSWKSSLSLPQFSDESLDFDIDVDENILTDDVSLIKRLNSPVSVETVKKLINKGTVKLRLDDKE